MYIKKKDRELFQLIDQSLKLPTKWNDFISERVAKNNFIIKTKNKYKCTYCHFNFEEKKKVNEYCKCPNCGNLFIVKSNRLKSYEFIDELAILDRYKKYYIVRQFRLHTMFKPNITKHYYYEYARVIFDEQFHIVEEIVNENVYGTPSGMIISCRESYSNQWRYFRSNWFCLPNQLIYYPYNLEGMLSSIKELKYSQIWELAKHVNYFDLINLIKNYNPSVELLTKMKLYNLALYPEVFKNKGNYEERFMGLPKDYLPFIQEYNLNLDELIALSYLKVKDINFIKRCEWLDQNQLEKLNKKVNLTSLIEKTNFNGHNFYEYSDYLDIAQKLKLNMKDKNILYPKNIKLAHDKLLKEYEQKKDEKMNKSIIQKYKKLKCNEFKDKKYIIFPAKDMKSLIDESSQQNNCVRTYAERIVKNECDIYFMRLITKQEHSLVTVEVVNNEVVQKRTKNNQITTKEQDKFLELWERKILKCKVG